MQLGAAITPLPSRPSVTDGLERLVDAYLAERGDSVALLQQTLERMVDLTTVLSDVLTAMLAAEPPVVNVTIPEAPEVEAPVVNVTVQEPPEVERGTRKRVVRDAQGLISEIIEEPI